LSIEDEEENEEHEEEEEEMEMEKEKKTVMERREELWCRLNELVH